MPLSYVRPPTFVSYKPTLFFDVFQENAHLVSWFSFSVTYARAARKESRIKSARKCGALRTLGSSTYTPTPFKNFTPTGKTARNMCP